jgi:uncharacterized protein (DUF3084 family)
MKKYFFLLVAFVALLPISVLAQDDAPKRPENMGVSDFDSFKNNSFDILDESTKLKTDATKLDTDVKSYSAGLAGVTVEKLKTDLKALRGISKSSKELTTRISGLDEQGKQMLASAKSVKPMTKSPQATGNTNKSIKGLEASRKNLDGVTTIVQENTKLLTDELKRRGETVEED